MCCISEPILAEAAAHYMSKSHILIDILRDLSSLLTTTAVASLGLLGELVAEIILLAAKNKAVIDTYKKDKIAPFSRPITVYSFLIALMGTKNVEKIFPLIPKEKRNLTLRNADQVKNVNNERILPDSTFLKGRILSLF